MTHQASVKHRLSSSLEDENDDLQIDSSTEDLEEEPAEYLPGNSTWSQIDPYEFYLEKKRKTQNNRRNPEQEGRTIRQREFDKPHYSEFEEYYGKKWTEERARKWHGLQKLLDDKNYPRSYGVGDTLIPIEYRLTKDFPAYITPNWKPKYGYPPCVFEHARMLSKSKKHQKGIAALDGFLFNNLIGRIPSEMVRGFMSSDKWKRTSVEKIQLDHWDKVAPYKKLITPNGELSGLASVYAISPDYLNECINSELDKGLFRSREAYESRKRYIPDNEMVTFSQTIPDDFADLLIKGTGLMTCPKAMYNLLKRPWEYLVSDYTVEEIWVRAVYGWRILSRYPLQFNLRPSWTHGVNGWLYTSNPMLQSLPKIVRLFGLRGVNDEKLVELDFTGCQLNIARAIAGMEVLEDPHSEIQTKLREMGIDIDRKLVKMHAITGFSGRTLSDYKFRVLQGKETDDPKHFEATLSVLSSLGYPREKGRSRRAQGSIMMEVVRRVAQETGYTGLPVHDAILVPSSFSDIAEAAMKEACIKVVGTELPYSKLDTSEFV